MSIWAYGEEPAYLPELITRDDRLSDVTETRLVLLTVTPEELRFRYERQPGLYFSLDIIQRANDRFPSLLPLLPDSLPWLHTDKTATPPEAVFA